ncbi:MAG TPA: peptidylprolyl isomerase [Pyrinomonadaceae bacterium]|nr:peptidylprolyl isomerase [Pyrinomonadaceae bacterium]
MRKLLPTLFFLLACAAASAGQTGAAGETSRGAESVPRENASETVRAKEGEAVLDTPSLDAPPRLARERLVLRTSLGDLVLAFYPDAAPEHTAQILRLARAGVYDGADFFRVEPGFVAQLADARATTQGFDPERQALIRPLRAEFNSLRHERGTLSMARHDGRPDSAETSFSILLGAAPHLDGNYTIFGKLEAGYDVLEAIGRVSRGPGNRPLRPVTVSRAEVVESAEALASLSLRGADFSEQQPPFFLLVRRSAWALGACAALGLALFVAAGRGRAAQWAGSAGLLLVLVGFFGLLVALLPEARTTQWASIPLFAGVVALFKLMNRFESARPQTRAEGK